MGSYERAAGAKLGGLGGRAGLLDRWMAGGAAGWGGVRAAMRDDFFFFFSMGARDAR